jgi:hypothetical protein
MCIGSDCNIYIYIYISRHMCVYKIIYTYIIIYIYIDNVAHEFRTQSNEV